MGRINFRNAIVTVLALLAIGLCLRLLGQEAAQKEQEPTIKKSDPTYDWRNVTGGIWAAHITQFPQDDNEKDKPEFSVLRVSREEYKEFRHHRVKFLNQHKIFSKDVNKQANCPVASGTPVNPSGTGYYLVFAHWPNSTALCTAYPIGG